jgi:hypothetical protein
MGCTVSAPEMALESLPPVTKEAGFLAVNSWLPKVDETIRRGQRSSVKHRIILMSAGTNCRGFAHGQRRAAMSSIRWM